MGHVSVLLEEVVDHLNLKSGDMILDATINGGGHAKEILKKIGDKGKLIGIEQDAVILQKTKDKIQDTNVILINGNFRDLDEFANINNIKEIDGAIFDLGISSLQLEESGRGFTFQENEPLLMTLKSDVRSEDLTAGDILNKWSEDDIVNILYEYGEERFGRKIARKIAMFREKREIKTTAELVEIIRLSVPPFYRNNRKTNCCTKTFQALRIAVNDELGALKEGISKAWNLLSPEARLVVISFHSLEDRIVKNYFKEKALSGEGKILTKKPIIPTEKEIRMNPRSRSAKMRVIEKI